MNNNRTMTLGLKIKALRQSKGLTQGELTRGEITPGLISQIESDRVAPSQRVIGLLAEQLGVTPEELFDEVETRVSQMQTLKEAREFLAAHDGQAAMPLLQRLQTSVVAYIPPMELQLEIAYAHELLNQVDEATRAYSAVEQHAFLHEEHMLGMHCMNRQGDFYVNQGKVSLALFCFKKALSFLQDMNSPNPQQMAVTRKNICICAYRLGNTELALEYAEAAYADLQGAGHLQELAEICHILSVLHVDHDSSEQALQFAADAVSIYRSLGLHAQLIDAKMNQAIVLRELGKCEEALQMIPTVIGEYYQQGRTNALSNAWTERAACELATRQYDDAARSLERSFALAAPDSLEFAEAWRVSGLLRVATQQPEQAIASFEQSLQILLRLHLIVTGQQVLLHLKDLYEQTGNIERAFEYHKRMSTLQAMVKQQLAATRITA